MRVWVTDDSVEVLLSRWQKILGLMKDIHVLRGNVSEVRVVEDPIRDRQEPLRDVLVSTPEAAELAQRLRGSGGGRIRTCEG